MSAGTQSIVALRAAVSEAGDTGDARLGQALEADAFVDGQVVAVPGEASIDHVIVRLAESMSIDELEATFGPGRDLPRRPSPGGRRQVIFEGTMPAEGSTGATLIAELDDDGRVERLVLRRDEL